MINERVYSLPWEDLGPGPKGEYVEVIDVDPASNCWYEPVDLDHKHLLAQDGLIPAASNPQFHQQMVYAVVMTTIKNFERAIGRPVMWSDRTPEDMGKEWMDITEEDRRAMFVERLAIYPHGLREANAYYSPKKKALLFGYFPASEAGGGVYYPGGIVFGCLSHDIIAHETAHAILDGIHPRFMDVTQPDGFAFHEAFADIAALFQHFTFLDVVRHQIAKTRGDLAINNLLGQLAQEFGRATGNRSSLRDALGGVDETGKWTRRAPDPKRLEETVEPHERGSILVSAVFDAFVTIYEARIADLRRIASGGTGILNEGELHPDLVNRLAMEAVEAAKSVLTMCIRALDYCPPVDISFGDYLRALITADRDVVANDSRGYRLAFIEAFRQHGIFPKYLRSLSEESLTWDRADTMESYAIMADLSKKLKPFFSKLSLSGERHERWEATRQQRRSLHRHLRKTFSNQSDDLKLQRETGLDFSIKRNQVGPNQGADDVRFEVHSMWPVQRQRPDGSVLNQVVFSILQHRSLDKDDLSRNGSPQISGGCTFIVDLDKKMNSVRYVIRKPLFNQDGPAGRIGLAREERKSPSSVSLAATYAMSGHDEPFAMLHAEI
ncbi:MAG: hypothetical protein JWM68_5454 [Verrucomicrobiales bacterium]|nr:hypothetical protein [Verrucomicrobiales bacterium]